LRIVCRDVIKRVFNEYRRLLRTLPCEPQSVLEVGALPTSQGLLSAPELKDIPSKTGINLTSWGEYCGVLTIGGDARQMPFSDSSFDLVLSSATIEHIPEFWRACTEMKRVLAPRGVLIISAPGFGNSYVGDSIRKLARKLRLPDLLCRGTPTMYIHEAPYDYYRFSQYAYHDFIMSGLHNVKVWQVMHPPRIFAIGEKPP
jgi:SAM-dependent methyltransferase